MKEFAILFLLGPDRPGIVDEVSTFLFARQANIEDSRMAIMGGCFSIMTLISCTKRQLETIKAELGQLENLGFEVSIHEAKDPEDLPALAELPLKLELKAMDHPGIMQKVVHILHEHNINIQSLNTRVTRAPLSGSPLFNLILEAGVPAEEFMAAIKEELTGLAAEMNLDLSFKT
ncbi:MAG: ACT domain-containing protein [Deltaproteobacteria bacterium]|nr:ACT domain-containing protein [Deltaproteobacteria bacterium]MBW2084714.1 ACT domain-containing protein [Deltaproteobacteria bacterium]